MLKVSLVALLVAAAAGKKPAAKKPKEPPPPAAVEPAPAPEPEPAPVAVPAPEPEPAKPAEPAPAAVATDSAPGIKPASAVETAKPKLVILEISAGGGIDPTVAAALGDAVTLEVQKRGYFTATSMKELQTMLGMERQRQLLGCSDSAATCMAELADAIGARFVLSGSLTRLGDAYQLSLQTIDTNKAQPIGRSVRIAKDPSALNEQVPYAVAEATATVLPPPPSRVLPYSMIIGGGVLLVASGVIALDSFSRDRAVQAEIDASEQNPALLRPLSSYRTDARNVSIEKTLSLVGLTVGAALVIGGVFLMPPSTPGGASVAIVPAGTGAAVVGVFP